MAIKIKRKSEAPVGTGDPLLDEPDQFFQTADQSLSWAAKNQRLIVLLVGLGLVLVLAGLFVNSHFQDENAAQSDALTAAVEILNAPVVSADDKNKPKGFSFPTEKEKYTALSEQAGLVISDYGDAGKLGSLYSARAAAGLGNYAEAVGLYQTWIDANDGSDEQPFVLQAMAVAQQADGKTDAAIGTLEKLKSIDQDAYGELASIQMGSVYESAGQKDKAKAAYEAVVKDYPDSAQLETIKMRLDLM
jgi:predicted negative regulator of RcsB-dependent stress response